MDGTNAGLLQEQDVVSQEAIDYRNINQEQQVIDEENRVPPNVDDNHNAIQISNNNESNNNMYHPENASLWTAGELFERIFPPLIPWWNDNDDHDNGSKKKKKRTSIATCPPVTLYFDARQKKTIVVLSGDLVMHQKHDPNGDDKDEERSNGTSILEARKMQAILSFLQSRVDQGFAKKRSYIYYELDGYVRSTFTQLRDIYYSITTEEFDAANYRHDETIHTPRMMSLVADITVAFGALDESDHNQIIELMDERRSKLEKLHPSCKSTQLRNEESILTVTELQSNTICETKSNTICKNEADTFEHLDEVLDIARLHRLQEDLDIISVYCMRLTSKSFGRVASRIARSKIMNAKMEITPYVDGILLSGYSRFMRHLQPSHNRQPVFRTTGSGKEVEYIRYDDVKLVPNDEVPSIARENTVRIHSEYKQQRASRLGLRTISFVPSPLSDRYFTWNCEEYTLPNLHCQDWGDILLRRDYVGQNLTIKWYPDLVEYMANNTKNGEVSQVIASVRIDPVPKDPDVTFIVPIAINNSKSSHDNSGMTHGNGSCESISNATIVLRIQESQRLVRDLFGFTATTIHHGAVEIQSLNVDFPCLVRSAATMRIPSLTQQYEQIQNYRPLLPHEHKYMDLVVGLCKL